jgi:hypothetical protein
MDARNNPINYFSTKAGADEFVAEETGRIQSAVNKWNAVQNAMLMDGGWLEKNPMPSVFGSQAEYDEYDARYVAEVERLNQLHGLREGDMPDGAENFFRVYVVEVKSGE